MKWWRLFGGGLAAVLATAAVVDAQEISQPRTPAAGLPPSGAVPGSEPAGLAPPPVAGSASGVETYIAAPAPSMAGAGIGTNGPDLPLATTGPGLEAESLPGELAEDISQARIENFLGPTPVSDVGFLMDNLGLRSWLAPPPSGG